MTKRKQIKHLQMELFIAEKCCRDITRQNEAHVRKIDDLTTKAKELTERNKVLSSENARLLDKIGIVGACDECVNIENYRKCVSCARNVKLKDKYEVEKT